MQGETSQRLITHSSSEINKLHLFSVISQDERQSPGFRDRHQRSIAPRLTSVGFHVGEMRA